MEIEGGAPKRFWAKHKVQAVLHLLRGEDIDLVSREQGVTAVMLSQWRDAFLEAGESGLKPHLVKESVEVGRLREKICEQAMENELLREKIARMEQNHPLASRGRGSEPGTLISTRKAYGLARVCRIWGLACSTVWQRQQPKGLGRRRGPQ